MDSAAISLGVNSLLHGTYLGIRDRHSHWKMCCLEGGSSVSHHGGFSPQAQLMQVVDFHILQHFDSHSHLVTHLELRCYHTPLDPEMYNYNQH